MQFRGPVVARVARALERTYGNPRHGNKSNPLDELVFILLSTRSREASFVPAYLRLRRAFPRWSDIVPGSLDGIVRAIRANGLAHLKAGQIVGCIVRLRATFGRTTLAPLKRMSDTDSEAFLVALPGVSQKVAKCVMMYSLDRRVLPVDVHVHRLAKRLGMRVKNRPDTSQDWIEDAVPPRFRYGFHVNAVAHGRKVCLPRNPRCTVCPLAGDCSFGRRRIRGK